MTATVTVVQGGCVGPKLIHVQVSGVDTSGGAVEVSAPGMQVGDVQISCILGLSGSPQNPEEIGSAFRATVDTVDCIQAISATTGTYDMLFVRY